MKKVALTMIIMILSLHLSEIVQFPEPAPITFLGVGLIVLGSLGRDWHRRRSTPKTAMAPLREVSLTTS